ncbi:androgen-induced gene 1 protein-like [Pectinophora gossypiella]|nr:androgen-induced gene 1 protein-like [Pectinophora gossypiella]XP_049875728.1 androgen-induced gene 1 protein-like [Pectinophora gossypiella]
MLLRTLFHLIGAIQFGYGCYYDYTYVNIPSTSTKVTHFGGKFKYLTYLNAMLQTLYFTVALLNDLIGTNEPSPPEKPLIRRLKDGLFSCLAFPLSMFVGLTFWGIYSVDRELILPRSLDPYFPVWLNHVMHTNIVLFVLVDLVSSFRMYPSRKQGLSVLSTFMVMYMVWVHIIYFRTGSWVYPILNVLNWPLRVVFYVFCLGLVCGMYSLGDSLNKSIWSKEMERTIRAGKKKAK